MHFLKNFLRLIRSFKIVQSFHITSTQPFPEILSYITIVLCQYQEGDSGKDLSYILPILHALVYGPRCVYVRAHVCVFMKILSHV